VLDYYSGVCEIILNENDSRAMFPSRFTVNKNRQERITSSNLLMFQNAFLGNVVITYLWGLRYSCLTIVIWKYICWIHN